MFSRTVAVISLLLIPSLTSAQRSGGGGGRTRGDKDVNWDEIRKGVGGAGLKLSNKDVENISPIKLLIDKRKDLKLSDAQTNQVKDLESKVKQQNEPFYKTLDSLRGVLKEPAGSGGPSDEYRARMALAHDGAAEAVRSIRENFSASLKEALALLDESQQKAANDLVAKQQSEAEEMLQDKLGGRGNGEQPSAGRRGRPPLA
jgi:hypothetical protein